MKWFSGDIAEAIQKAIKEKKVFLVFVRGDNEDSKTLEELWEDETLSQTCCDDRCVAVNIVADSVSGQQFSSIYPILCVPSTYLINCEGLPTDIIPGILLKEEFIERLKNGIQKTLDSTPSTEQTTDSASAVEESADATVTEQNEKIQESAPKNITVAHEGVDESTPAEPDDLSQTDFVQSSVMQKTETAKEKADRLLEKSRVLQAEKEKEKQKEIERKRQEEGVELTRAKRDMAERQAKKLADEISKQKAEEKAAREKVREQIRRDKVEKAARYEREKQQKQQVIEQKKAEKVASEAKIKETKESSTRIQFRLPDGSASLKQFEADTNFLVVLNHARELVPDLQDIRLTTVFPKHEFTNEDNMKSLRELNLVPSASIIVSRGAASGENTTSVSLNPISLIMLVIAPILALFKWLISLFTDQTSNMNRNQEPQHQPGQTHEPNYTSNSRNTESLRRRVGNNPNSNIRLLRRDENDDDENGTWNGNSTQQM